MVFVGLNFVQCTVLVGLYDVFLWVACMMFVSLLYLFCRMHCIDGTGYGGFVSLLYLFCRLHSICNSLYWLAIYE